MTAARAVKVAALCAVVVACVVVLFLWLRSPAVPGHGALRDCNLVLVTIDTLRADHLPAYGYRNVRTPALDAFAESGYLFSHAVAHVPLTLPSHTSILTGLLPMTHGVRDNANFLVSPADTTLAEILKSNGYTTAAFVSAFVLDSRWQLNQGFDSYYDDFNLSEYQDSRISDIQRKAGETQAEVDRWLEKHHDRKFFLWVHYYDPHYPYDPPEPYRTEYASHPYDGEIAYTDESVGRLLEDLRKFDLRKRTIVVITGDHGEGLGEHQESAHGIFVYGATTAVPLLISVPGGAHRRVPQLVRHIDIAPTVLDWLGIQPPPAMQGASLVPLLQGREEKERTAYTESLYAELHYGWSPLKSLVSGKYRFIEAPKPELYDLQADAGELNNLVAEKPYIAKAMQGQLDEMERKFSRKSVSTEQKVDPEVEEKLRALGYTSGTTASAPGTAKADPKDKIQQATAIANAFEAMQRQNSKQAIAFIAPVLVEDPNIMDAHFVAGVAYADQQQYDRAIDELLKTIHALPNHLTAMYNLAYAYHLSGKPADAEQWYLQVLKMDPEHMLAMMKLSELYRQMNRPEKAQPYYQKAVAYYKEMLQKTSSADAQSRACSSLAELYFSAGELALAEESLKQAVQLTPATPMIHYNLAQVYEAKQDMPSAADAYLAETRLDPSNFRAFHNLGLVYLQMRQYENASGCFQSVLKMNPQDLQATFYLAESYYLADRNLQEAQRLAGIVTAAAPQFREGRELAAAIAKKLK